MSQQPRRLGMPPSPRSLEVLRYIAGRSKAPTYGEINRHMGWKGKTCSQTYVNRLVITGHLRKREDRGWRALELTPLGLEAIK